MSQRVGLALGLGVLSVSWAAIFIRLANAPSLTVAAWRLTLAGVPVAVWALLRHRAELKALDARERRLLFMGGLALAAHFGTWISSLTLTSVASSVALVTTTPVWVALRERPPRRTLVGMAIAMAGTLLIAGTDFALDARSLKGDALALLGAWCAASYLSVGKRMRQQLPVAAYVGVVYPVAGVLLMIVAFLAHAPLLHLAPQSWVWLVLVALVPQLIGHSLLNWALEHTTAAVVAIAILGEPVFATLLAIPLLGEVPGPMRVAGAAVVLIGVAVATTARPDRA